MLGDVGARLAAIDIVEQVQGLSTLLHCHTVGKHCVVLPQLLEPNAARYDALHGFARGQVALANLAASRPLEPNEGLAQVRFVGHRRIDEPAPATGFAWRHTRRQFLARICLGLIQSNELFNVGKVVGGFLG